MLLAGDIGGTKAIVGLFARGGARPTPIDIRSYRTSAFPDLVTLCRQFLRDASADASTIQTSCFGVAGPVAARRARLTNVPWEVDADAVSRELRLPHVDLLNDLEATAWAVPVLMPDEIAVLQSGDPEAANVGSAALIAAGTGLGVALLPQVDGRFVPQSSEGGHVDFAARTANEQQLQAALMREYGRAELEQVLSGPGLVNIHRFVHPHTCEMLSRAPQGSDEFPALISLSALEGGCAECRKTLEMFVGIYGASAGNLALTTMATAGVYLGGGIAPRILPALHWPIFEEAFRAKAPLEGLMRRIPVRVILNPVAALIGAATFSAAR
ncbi:MAG: glucokinase [Vicinamibacterales bacterium]|nr:glucokinase [Vicinamibacterales bacterium]